MILDLKEHDARCVPLVGCKAASLALLGSVQNNEYAVPEGICLTVNALNLQLKNYDNIREAIERIEKVSCGAVSGDLEEICQK